MNKYQWNLNRNSIIFIQENAFEDLVCEMTAILSKATNICVTGPEHHWSSNGLSPVRHQPITWTKAYLIYCQLDPQEQYSVKFG